MYYNALTLATRKTDLDLEHYKRRWTEEKWITKELKDLKPAYYQEVKALTEK